MRQAPRLKAVTGPDGPDFGDAGALTPRLTPAEQQRRMAATTVAQAAAVVLNHPRDPEANEAEAQLETMLEILLTLHWSGEGEFDGLVHTGIERRAGRVVLSGAARVLQGTDRQVRVDISPITGGTVIVDRPAPRKRRLLGRRTAAATLAARATQLISIPPAVLTLGE